MNHRCLALLSIPLLAAATLPCIWDKDTIRDELRGLPGAFDLVSGRFHVHDPAYYELRIGRLPALLKQHPDRLAAYDDLAVAHERLAQREQAIAVMARKLRALQAKPDKEQQYRYHANLGTFYAHSGRFDEALVELNKAITPNPDAHFGRERFQIDLIRYVKAARQNPDLWGEQNFLSWSGYQIGKRRWTNFLTKIAQTTQVRKAQDKATSFGKALEAVGGMTRFGGLEGPELFRAMGDLFTLERHLHLAWWSYQRAVERGHPAKAQLKAAITSIERHWRDTKKHVGGVGQIPTLATFRKIRKQAEAWRAAFRKAERAALAEGEDPGSTKVLERLLSAADRAVPRPTWAKAAVGAEQQRVRRARGIKEAKRSAKNSPTQSGR